MAKTPLTSFLAAFRASLARVEQEEGFAVSELKIDFPALVETKGAEVFLELPDPTSTINPAYLSKLSVSFQSMGPSAKAVGDGAVASDPWKPVYSGTTESLYGICADKSGEIFAVGKAGTVLWSTDGISFGLATDITQDRLHAVWSSGSGEVCVAGVNGLILRRSSPNGSWTKISTGQKTHINGIWGNGAGDVIAVCGKGRVLLSDTGGKYWPYPIVDIGVPYGLHGVWGSGTGLLRDGMMGIYVVGDDGTLCHSTDGKSFTSQKPSGRDLHAVWGSGPNDIYVVGTGGQILHSSDGVAWVPQTSGTNENLYGIWGSGPNDVYAVGRKGTIVHTTNNGSTWTVQKSGTTEALHAIAGRGPKEIWIVGTGGVILKRAEMAG